MSRHLSALLIIISGLAAAPTTRADNSVIVEGFGGWHDVQVKESTAGGTTSASGGGNAVVGGDLMFRFGWVGIGVVVDKTLGGSVKPWSGAVDLGFLIDPLPSLRLEALGEVGRYGPDFGDIFGSAGGTFLGVRPGVSFRLVPAPIRVGVAVPIRWLTSGGDFGSPDWGFVGKIGFEFP
jgi:hypothetical protein